MTEPTRTFELGPILQLICRYPIKATPYQEFLQHLTGDPISSPMEALRWRQVCHAWVTEQHPRLAQIGRPDLEERDFEAWDQWAAEVAETLGTHTLAVTPLPLDRRTPDSLFDVLADADALHKTYVHPAR
ncbi:hypothetical protein ACIQNU_04135 [Streptomyces sp. NPDC091292]|uniref:hypothetical protein n=1 Tax=Streptomyces sp. NPDC091292 TaxID=3365991 RepID=UPI003826120F